MICLALSQPIQAATQTAAFTETDIDTLVPVPVELDPDVDGQNFTATLTCNNLTVATGCKATFPIYTEAGAQEGIGIILAKNSTGNYAVLYEYNQPTVTNLTVLKFSTFTTCGVTSNAGNLTFRAGLTYARNLTATVNMTTVYSVAAGSSYINGSDASGAAASGTASYAIVDGTSSTSGMSFNVDVSSMTTIFVAIMPLVLIGAVWKIFPKLFSSFKF